MEKTDVEEDTSFILKKTVKSGNYSILKKGINHQNIQRIRYTVYGAYLPFGCESYKDKNILNVIINNSTNINHNLLVKLKRIIDTFEYLKTTSSGKNKYLIHDKTFFSFLKKMDTDDDNDTDNEKYQMRFYLKYGAKVTHTKHVGEIDYSQLKGTRCNLDIELGSMWVSEETKQYGINIFVTGLKLL